MSKAYDKALEAFPIIFSERFCYDKTNIWQERRNAFEKGYEQAIADAKEWLLKNASKDIYKNYDSTGICGYWSQGLAKDLENNLIGES